MFVEYQEDHGIHEPVSSQARESAYMDKEYPPYQSDCFSPVPEPMPYFLVVRGLCFPGEPNQELMPLFMEELSGFSYVNISQIHLGGV